jgi:hypothetical protein
MKLTALVPMLALSFVACTATKDDSGDTGGGGTPFIQGLDASCTGDTPGATCTWSIDADATIGTVELQLVETGDPTFDTSCTESSTSGGLVCGVWSEYHDDFELVTSDNDFGGDTKSINLELVGSFEDQVNNQSTLFKESIMGTTLTAMFTLYDSSGAYADCVVIGHNPAFFSSVCSNTSR